MPPKMSGQAQKLARTAKLQGQELAVRPSQDPVRRLQAAAALLDTARELAALLGAEARASGASWSEIAAPLGITRQAAHARYGTRTSPRARPDMAHRTSPPAGDVLDDVVELQEQPVSE